MPLEFIKSQRGRDLLIYNGFIHKQEKTIENKIIWKCNEKKKCTGRAHTIQGKMINLYILGIILVY